MSIKIVKGSYTSIVDSASLSGNQTLTLPNASGTVALTNQFATVATSGSYNDLTDKPTIPGEQNGYVTEIWKNEDGTSWYRIWSDGWIEQGGTLNLGTGYQRGRSLTFPIAFTTTDFSIVFSGSNSGANTVDLGTNNIGSRKITGVTYVIHCQSGVAGSWYACGY